MNDSPALSTMAGPTAALPSHTRPVGILGGMGPAAGADFVRLFVQACIDRMRQHGQVVSDQAFPEHWLVQVPVPDRTQALITTSEGSDAAFDVMANAIGRMEGVGAQAVAIACNTAHAWHDALQTRFPRTELLHVAREVTARLQLLGVTEVCLLATQGTYRTRMYEIALAHADITCHLPLHAERETLMRGIYEGVKTGDMALAQHCFVEVAQKMMARHGNQVLIMGCTEIPMALPSAPQAAQWMLVNSAQVLAMALANRAYSD